ncbi:MAG TPA: metal-dependent hydrolase [Actinopolymorphaceae bacterium]
MWRTHAASGLAVGALSLAVLPIDGVVNQFAWVVACSGAALLPDWDHRSSSVTVMWGPLSRAVHAVVHVVFRGHRGGTHDWFVSPAIFAGLAYLASLHEISTAIAIAVVVGAALRALAFVIPGDNERFWPVNLAVSAGVGYLVAFHARLPWWLPVAFALGVVTHIVGDAVTRSSVPRPFSWLDGRDPGDAYEGGPLRTASWYENWLVFPGLLLVTLVALYLGVPEIAQVVSAVTGH